MMYSFSLRESALALVQRLGERIEDVHGLGFMSPAVYDTAWVSMVSKTENDQKMWLFPECFEYILFHQLEDGGWATYASEIDGILNTGASLLALKKHLDNPYQIISVSQRDLTDRIDRARVFLGNLLNGWNVESTLHVGFEILVPALLRYLEEEGITFSFPARERLLEIEKQKLSKFKAEHLYLPIKLSALHSLEAFIGVIDFDKVGHHKANGSFMASPSSTAAFLMHALQWDDECENYLKNAISSSSGQGSGGVPSAFPSTIFECTWPLATLLKVGYVFNAEIEPAVQKIRSYLHNTFTAEKGVVGFTPLVTADADDTATTALVLNLLNQSVSVEAMLNEFEEDHHFKTYSQERNPSFSANCNVLLALLYTPDPSVYTSQIEKATAFLYKKFTDSDLDVQDKWLLLSSEIRSLMVHGENEPQKKRLHPSLRQEIEKAISSGCSVLLDSTAEFASGWLWIEKVTYKSEVLAEAYVLAALKRAADLTRDNISNHNANGVYKIGVNEHSALPNHTHSDVVQHSLQTNGNGSHDEEPVKNGGIENDSSTIIHTNGTANGYYQRSEWTADQEQILLGPFDYLESLPGKNIRSQLIQAFNKWLKVPEKSLTVIENVISMLHTASLLIDDIQDQSLLRRGQPVAHSIFGTAQTMNSGNYIYFTALREIQQLNNPQAIDIYVNSLIDLHRGQGMELFWRDSLMCPTEEEYLDMVANKTGGLFCLAVQLMQVETTVEVDFVPLVRLLGIIFQICDDYLNLQSTAYTDNKGLCEDLTEGKFSFPIIHSIRKNPGNRQLINILKQKPREDDLKRYALSYMEGTDSFNYTRGVVNKLKEEAFNMIHCLEKQDLEENMAIRKLLARISLEL
ncbi:hypothetical protein UA08_07231 [Talaromyces atroroseus]|uniref:Geranylgeranyl pyrophosphate synthase n=1 Tax=Talaromyces atroroseus TaxID=1441469 RepID=A0A225AQ51_TALAT|nr:hypothetical protein UA08_07231 [Talaromyces atroroseus]OKL57729.1 hypothetical protein UA08_07231 [Talaromyces atroroseus]